MKRPDHVLRIRPHEGLEPIHGKRYIERSFFESEHVYESTGQLVEGIR